MIPKQLITQLNSGRCFALVGSGPSTAMGYPSWSTLAADAKSLLSADAMRPDTIDLIDELESQWRLPELFDIIADHVGGMPELVAGLKHKFVPQSDTGAAYEFLAKWPFRCYLTTNYDNEIPKHLARIGVHFAHLNNSQADFAQSDAYASERIVKLHGDFDFLDGLVLGQRQYQEFKVHGRRSYFREKLKSIFSMIPVVVIGHSLSDPDIALILEMAEELNSLDRPIYMILADVSRADSRKYREQFNIHLLSYNNADRTHGNLLRLLRMIDRFVIPRSQCASPLLDPPNPEEARIASSLYLFSKGTPHKTELMQRALTPQVLSMVGTTPGKVFTLEELQGGLLPTELRHSEGTLKHVESAVEALLLERLVERRSSGIKATDAGLARLAEVTRGRELLEAQVFDRLKESLLATGSEDSTDITELVDGFRNTLIAVFRQRALCRLHPFVGPVAVVRTLIRPRTEMSC